MSINCNLKHVSLVEICKLASISVLYSEIGNRLVLIENSLFYK